jgi:4-amino-4-deoxy-L-arabinose transferase-like glycosyltransferase
MDRRQAVGWHLEREFWLLIGLVVAIYFTRLTALPVAGEEGRWGSAAAEMLHTGDWLVLRQQGTVFSEKPPMTAWAMAAVGYLRGGVDDVAVRLPSVVSVLLTSVLLYWYARQFLSPLGALAGGVAYATMGQVLQIGRMGESEALFTLLTSAALLVWHAGYVAKRRPTFVWLAGYVLAALACYVKTPQAIVYFVSVTGVYLVWQRSFGWLFSAGHVFGMIGFAATIALWEVPYFLATNWNHTIEPWFGLAADRFGLQKLPLHLATYPLETFACLLPWSPLLLAFALPQVWRALRADEKSRELLMFAVIVLVVTYPSVLFAATASTRYFMPLYPCVALLAGLLVEHGTTAAAGSALRAAWQRFAWSIAAALAIGAVVVVAVPVVRQHSLLLTAIVAMTGVIVAGLWIQSARIASHRYGLAAMTALSAFVAVAYTGLAIDMQRAAWNDARPAILATKERLPQPDELVSFGTVDHRFAYIYDDFIPEKAWPIKPEDVPEGVEYFCFNRMPWHRPDRRGDGRGRTKWITLGIMPFEWEEVAVFNVERRIKSGPQPEVVIGRIVRRRDTRLASQPATGAETPASWR